MIAVAVLLATSSVDPISGTWEGTSLCQVRPSPCRDEHVIYRITPLGAGNYRNSGYKLVNGQEQFMGDIDLAFDANRNELTGYFVDRSGGRNQWQFTLKGSHMSGRLVTPDGRLFRLIEIDKR